MSEAPTWERVNENRRTFLKVSVAAGGGLLVGFYLPALTRAGQAEANPPAGWQPNAWIRIGADDTVTLVVGSSEMGQGVFTSVPMMLAEELDCDWSRVRVEQAPAAKAFFNPIIGQQLTGGSTTVRAFYVPLRQAGAAARELLIAAAAEMWGVKASDCRAERGVVLHRASGRRARYAALVGRAAKLPPPEKVTLKSAAEFKLLGTPVRRLDTPRKTDGSATFGLDVKLPGMLTAVVARCPVFGGRLRAADTAKARAVDGVRDVLMIDSGVAVVAENFWAAKRGRDALAIDWDEGPNAGVSSADIRTALTHALERAGAVARRDGDIDQGFQTASTRIESLYEVPYLAHACMEPMNCTAWVTKTGCDVWAGTQAQTGAQRTAAKIAGLAPEAVRVHTTFLGGGFGRRSEQDFVAEAVQLSKAMAAPVKVVWTREDDIQHDFYRPAMLGRLSCGLDAKGNPVAWRHQIAGPSIFARVFPGNVKDGIDQTSVEGAADLPYAIPNIEVTYAMENGPVPVGFWRSVGSSHNAFITECFLDEVAAQAHRDPYELRRALLVNKPRHRAVLELAAEKAGWGNPLAPGRYRGIAVAESFGSYVAEVAEISISDTGVRVHRVVCAVDCGAVVNPDTVDAQMQSGIVYGLTAALRGEITIKDGRVQQSNFTDYPLLRIDEMPVIDVHIVKSDEPPGGVGEPGTPPIAPAVANAVFAATGKPVRKLPIRL
jgi:isoquinoline 1-oxidoreductase beta subunit